jgi:hypothetical protein
LKFVVVNGSLRYDTYNGFLKMVMPENFPLAPDVGLSPDMRSVAQATVQLAALGGIAVSSSREYDQTTDETYCARNVLSNDIIPESLHILQACIKGRGHGYRIGEKRYELWNETPDGYSAGFSMATMGEGKDPRLAIDTGVGGDVDKRHLLPLSFSLDFFKITPPPPTHTHTHRYTPTHTLRFRGARSTHSCPNE